MFDYKAMKAHSNSSRESDAQCEMNSNLHLPILAFRKLQLSASQLL